MSTFTPLGRCLSHPVLKTLPISNLGKKCASVLITTLSNGNSSSGPNSNQKYLRDSARQKLSILSRCVGGILFALSRRVYAYTTCFSWCSPNWCTTLVCVTKDWNISQPHSR